MKLSEIDCWKIRILASKEHPFEKMAIGGDCILELSDFESLKIVPCSLQSTIIEADPFIFVKNGILYLFYESKNIGENGEIRLTTTGDLKTWTAPTTVLSEQYHLSYPFVFEELGEVYMIPETGICKSIRLYKAVTSDLTKWEYVRTLVNEDSETSNVELSFCDSSICKYNGTYYIFTTIVRNNTTELHIYYSHSLESLFIRHPMNPVVKNNKYGRGAGSIISYKGKMYRVSQDCSKSYGENVCVLEIKHLSSQRYQEEILTNALFERNDPFYKYGAHQFNVVRFQDKYIVATDAKGYRKLLVQRLLSKLFKRHSK